MQKKIYWIFLKLSKYFRKFWQKKTYGNEIFLRFVIWDPLQFISKKNIKEEYELQKNVFNDIQQFKKDRITYLSKI